MGAGADRLAGGVLKTRLPGPDIALNQLAARDKQVEMAFYLPIAQLLTAERLDALIRQYDPLSADTPPLDFRQVRGMLKGFIDLVFRHEGRYYLLDYKSNWLGEDREAYTRPAMEQAMRAHRYDLQYQLYSLALHRYLRHRLADYDYDRHFGGVIYLFLRGMDGQEGAGIFTTRPVRPLIDGLDQLLPEKLRRRPHDFRTTTAGGGGAASAAAAGRPVCPDGGAKRPAGGQAGGGLAEPGCRRGHVCLPLSRLSGDEALSGKAGRSAIGCWPKPARRRTGPGYCSLRRR